MYILRDYQQKAVDANLNLLFDKRTTKNGLSVLPTGSGKSLIIANIVKELDEPAIIFQPSKEILEQNYSKLNSYGVVSSSIYSASLNQKVLSPITFATIGSVIRKPEIHKLFKYILVDEAHLVNAKGGMYKQFINNSDAKVIGFTATPYRLATNSFGAALRFLTRTSPRIFNDLIHCTQTRELFQKGFLSKTNYYNLNIINKRNLISNSTGADYTDRSVLKEYERVGYNDQLLSITKRLLKAGKTKILVFTRFVHEAEYLVNKLGSSAAVVSAKTKKKDRETLITEFRAGLIKVVANVGVLTVGFDFPELEVVLMARPTKSLALYYQMGGRVIRPHPSKKESWIVDMGSNYATFGKIEDLEIVAPRGNLWQVESKGKVLTNIYY